MRMVDYRVFKSHMEALKRSRKLVIIENGLKYTLEDIRRKSLKSSKTYLKIQEDTLSRGILIAIPESTHIVYLWDNSEEDIDLYDDLDVADYICSDFTLWWTTIEVPRKVLEPLYSLIFSLLGELELPLSNCKNCKVSFLDRAVVGFVGNKPVFSLVSENDFGKTMVLQDDKFEVVAKPTSKDDNQIIIAKTSTGVLPYSMPSLKPNSTFSGICMKSTKKEEETPVPVTPVFLKVMLNGVLYTGYAVAVSDCKDCKLILNEGKEIDLSENLLCLEILSRSFNN
jgi:hypothetical protein